MREYQRKQLPAGPLAALLLRHARDEGLKPLARRIGEDHGSLCRMIKGAYIQEATADRICIALGTHPAIIWPEDWVAFWSSEARASGGGKHGTRWGYDRGCRCGECLEAGRVYYRARERRRAAA